MLSCRTSLTHFLSFVNLLLVPLSILDKLEASVLCRANGSSDGPDCAWDERAGMFWELRCVLWRICYVSISDIVHVGYRGRPTLEIGSMPCSGAERSSWVGETGPMLVASMLVFVLVGAGRARNTVSTLVTRDMVH